MKEVEEESKIFSFVLLRVKKSFLVQFVTWQRASILFCHSLL